MKTFKLIANCTFEAENIEDAFLKLADHFDYQNYLCAHESEDLNTFTSGSIEIKPIEEYL